MYVKDPNFNGFIFVCFVFQNHGCPDLQFTGDCSHQIVFSAILFAIYFFIVFGSCVLAWVMLANFKFDVGIIYCFQFICKICMKFMYENFTQSN